MEMSEEFQKTEEIPKTILDHNLIADVRARLAELTPTMEAAEAVREEYLALGKYLKAVAARKEITVDGQRSGDME